MSKFPFRRMLAGTVLVSQVGCTALRTLPDAAGYVAERRPIQARLLLTDGTERTLEAPAVFQDSLIGLDESGVAASIAVGDVSGVRVRVPSTIRTVALVGGLGIGLTLLVFAAGGTGPEES